MRLIGLAARPGRAHFALSRRYLTTLGIRREDPSRIWERRAALTPGAVEELVQGGKGEVRVEVESCARRCFSDTEYASAGASIVPTLSGNVDVVIGIKEPPVAEVQKLLKSGERRPRSWMVFSHTHKGQEYNVPLLSTFLDPNDRQTLIDHELLTQPEGGEGGKLKRVAAFGWYAGAVGAGEALSMTGLALLKRGIATPLLNLPRPYTFATRTDFEVALTATGERVRAEAKGEEPIVIGITGDGNVSTGAKAMLDALGVEWVEWRDLPGVMSRSAGTVYACMIPSSAYFVHRETGTYDQEDYYRSPGQYTSVFGERIAPYLTTLINGAGWSKGFPPIISKDVLARLTSGSKQKLVAVQDITCDIEGNLEFINQHATIDAPHYEGPGGILISSIDILPTELAADASSHFSGRILPYVRHLLVKDGTPQIADSLQRAKIVDSGKLTDRHLWLEEKVNAARGLSSSSNGKQSIRVERKRVLLLGSGLVAGPAVKVFAARPDVKLVIASNNLQEAFGLAKSRANIEAVHLDVSDARALSEAVRNVDVVVSLLPAPMHPKVAEWSIEHGKHMVTASYNSPDIKALSKRAEQKDVLLLGECGLDPGIDSMAAMRILSRVQREGKRVTSFKSWCGGLPEPSASNVPLGYKFSWSPRAVLTAAGNAATFKLDGKVISVPGDQLLANHFPKVDLWRGLALEGLANRDSMPYAEKYGLGPVEGLTNLFRGTLRYQGFSRVLDAFRGMGLLSQTPLDQQPARWSELVRLCQAQSTGAGASADLDEAMHFLGLAGKQADTPLPPALLSGAPIDLLAARLSEKLAYAPDERDICLLHHEFLLAPRSAGEPSERVTASLYCTGTAESSAMALTVGRTLALAAMQVADGQVGARGVRGPEEKDVWQGVLGDLEESGVVVRESWETVSG